MAKVQKISGFDEFKAKIQEINATATELVVYFSGSKTRSGRSWCPDCNDGKLVSDVLAIKLRQKNLNQKCIFSFSSAEPFVNQYGIKNATSDRTFVIVDVGDRVT